jgi:hypothetical protein
MIKNIELADHASKEAIAGLMLTSNSEVPVVNKTIKRVMKNKKVVELVSYHWVEFNEQAPLVKKQPTNSPVNDEFTVEYQVGEKINLHELIPLSHQATLAEAYLALVHDRRGGVYIYKDNIDEIIGMVTFEQIRQYLVNGKLIIGVLPTPALTRECVLEGKLN